MGMTPRNMRKETVSASDGLLIFVFFLIGAAAAISGQLRIPEMDSPRLFFCALFGAVILLSTSSFGWLFLPLCVFVYGLYAEQSAITWSRGFLTDGFGELRQVLCSFFILPAFFLTGTHGLCVSSALHNALDGAGPTSRAVYQTGFSRVLLSALLGLAAVFFFYSQ